MPKVHAHITRDRHNREKIHSLSLAVGADRVNLQFNKDDNAMLPFTKINDKRPSSQISTALGIAALDYVCEHGYLPPRHLERLLVTHERAVKAHVSRRAMIERIIEQRLARAKGQPEIQTAPVHRAQKGMPCALLGGWTRPSVITH